MVENETLDEWRRQVRAAMEKVRSGDHLGPESGLDPASLGLLKDLDDQAVDALVEVYAALATFLEQNCGSEDAARMMNIFSTASGAESVYATLTEAGLISPEKPADLNADGARLFYTRGQRAFKSERYKQAKNYFKRAVEISPGYKDAWNALASTYERLGDSAAADEAFARACELE